MPRSNRSIVHKELVLLLVLLARGDFDGAFDERKGVLDLFKVLFSFEVGVVDFVLLINSYKFEFKSKKR